MPPVAYADPVPSATLPVGSVGAVSLDVSGLVDEWQRNRNDSSKGFPNYGIQLTQRFVDPGTSAQLDCDFEQCPYTGFYTAYNADPAKRPLLEVRSYPGAAAGNAVISPGEGDLTSRRVKLQARALASSVTSVRFQWIGGTLRAWQDIPASALKSPTTRGTLVSNSIPVSGPTGDRRSDLVVWDIGAQSAGGIADGPVHVRAWLESPTIPSDGGMTDPFNFRLDRRGIDKAPRVPIGPGSWA